MGKTKNPLSVGFSWCLIPEAFGMQYEAINSIAQEIDISKSYLGSELDEELFNVSGYQYNQHTVLTF